jgi:hypothetical protein
MSCNENEKNGFETIESFNVCRAWVMGCLSKFRKPGMKGRMKVVDGCLTYFDLIVRSMTEQGLNPVVEANELRKTLSEKLLSFVVDFDNGRLTGINAVSQMAGIVVEYGYKTFAVEAEFFMQPVELENKIIPQSLN